MQIWSRKRVPQRLQICILQWDQSELFFDLGRSLQVRFRPVETAWLRFVAGKVELNSRPAARVRIACGRGLIQCALRIFCPVSRWNGF